MNIVLLIGLFILWVIFWSFGSVIVQRMQRKINFKVLKWFLVGRSECPSCHHTLARYDLIPLFSWISTRGKCRYCGTSISSLYPVLELVSGFVFLLWWWIYYLPYSQGLWELGMGMLVARWLLGLLLVWDMYTYELHVPVWFILCVVVVILTLIRVVSWTAEWDLLWIPAVFLGLFVGIYQFGRLYTKLRFWYAQEAFGQGDVMLAPILGSLFVLTGLGQHSLFSLLVVFVLVSCVAGLVYYVWAWLYRSVTRNRSRDHIHTTWTPMLPFLPAMIVSYRVIVLWVTLYGGFHLL